MRAVLDERVTLAIAKTPVDYLAIVDDLEPFLDVFAISRRTMLDWLYDETPLLTVYYVDGVCAGVLGLLLHRKSAEVHGAVLPEFAKTDLSETMSSNAMRAARVLGYARMTAKVPTGNKGALGWVRINGFKRSPRKDDGYQVYVKDLEPIGLVPESLERKAAA